MDVQTVPAQVDADPYLARIKKELLEDSDAWPKYSLEHGHLLYKGQLVLPKNSSVIPSLLQEFHAGVIGGHSGFLRTYKRLANDLILGWYEGNCHEICC